MLTGVRGRFVDSWSACLVNLRVRNLRNAQASFGLMWTGEWAATVAVAVIAFDHGGAAAVGLVGFIRMTPAALVTPFAATIADRMRREWVLSGIGGIRAISLGAAAAVTAAGSPIAWVYLAVAVATIAQTLFRPAHSALLPSLCSSPSELTAANVARGLLDSLATLIGPLCAALLLKLSGPAAVLIAAAAASALAGMFAHAVRYEAPPRLDRGRASVSGQVIEGVRAIASDRALALITWLGALQTFVRGALTVFSVVIAVRLLGTGTAGVGVLTAAVGAGAVLGSLSAALLVGRGALARWFGVGIALWGLPLAVIAVLVHAWVALLMLAIAGIGNALVDVGGFTLLARLAHDSVLARVCGAFEGIITLGVAAGALVTPLLITEFGTRAALAIVGVITPAAVLASWRSLRVLDRRMEVRDSDIALLQGVPMLRPLPEATIEQLAASLSYAQLPAGVAVFEQGDDGDVFYVIERGRANLFVDGEPVRALSSGEGFGEIALIGDRRRTASVCAATDLTLRGLERAVFVAAVAGYSQSAEAVHLVIDEHLDRFRPGAIPG